MKNYEYRKANGKRLEGQGLVTRIASDIVGMMLAQAFVFARHSGFLLNVMKIDGATHHSLHFGTINVDVVDGVVKKSWTTT